MQCPMLLPSPRTPPPPGPAGTDSRSDCPVSPAVAGLLAALQALEALVDATPPAQQPLRYGNPAFRSWHAAMTAAAPQLLSAVLPQELQGAVGELAGYWCDSFGNATRIDYGTGERAGPAVCGGRMAGSRWGGALHWPPRLLALRAVGCCSGSTQAATRVLLPCRPRDDVRGAAVLPGALGGGQRGGQARPGQLRV